MPASDVASNEPRGGTPRWVSRNSAVNASHRGAPPFSSSAALAGGAARQGRLQVIQASLLVVHGTEDPVFPIEHGVALSDLVEGATLVRLEGGGHELHEADWQEIIAAIVAHTGQ
jgi:pimeloyl-ACP methyl ester carboxylesterase